MRKIPLRRCVVTDERLPKKSLIRVVRTPEGQVVVDPSGKANGRGAYLKIDAAVFEQARKRKVLDRQLGCPVGDDVFAQLDQLLKK